MVIDTLQPFATVNTISGKMVKLAAENSPTLAIVGSGSVGGFYGARLASVAEVSFLMRRDLAAVRERGLIVHSIAGDLHLDPVRAFATTAEIGPVDLVVIAIKSTANDALPDLLPPLLKPGTILLTLQNGLATGNGRPVRSAILDHYAAPIAALYHDTQDEENTHVVL